MMNKVKVSPTDYSDLNEERKDNMREIELSVEPMLVEGGETAGKGDDQLFEDFRADVKRRIETFQEMKKAGGSTDEDSEFNTTEGISTSAYFMRQANCCDKVYMGIAFTASFIFGSGMPGFSVFFGGMIDGMGESAGDAESTYMKD